MSRGFGSVQRRILELIGDDTEPVRTFDLVADVYDIPPDPGDGYRYFDDAQIASVRRALAKLRRAGLLAGSRGYNDRQERWARPARMAEEVRTRAAFLKAVGDSFHGR